ncbi:MAG: methyl-coenzyme M reductase glutamine C-methyltransferase [Methanotrichaceae archaeon]
MKIDIVSPGIYTYGSMILGGILKEGGHSVALTRQLRSDGDVTLLSLFSTIQLIDPQIKEFVKNIQHAYVGGPVSFCPEMVLGELDVDAVIVGEGEEIVSRLVEEGPSSDIPGVVFKEGGEIIKTNPEPVKSLDHPLPFIPEDLNSQNVRGANIYIETHRGCLGRCTFCQVPRFFGRTIRSRSLENILEEVRELKRHGIRRVAISGGTGSLFGYSKEVNRNAVIELLQSLSDILGPRNLSVPDMRVDFVDREILEAVRDYTIGWVFFGLESGSQRMLKAMKKGVTVKKNMDAIELARSCGVKVGGSFIVGYPGETIEDYQETLDFMEDAMLDDVFVSVAEPIPGTDLARLALSYPKKDNPLYQDHCGEYKALKFSEAEARCFNQMLHGQNCKLVPRLVNDAMYNNFLEEARTQGRDIKNVMKLLEKYREYVA